MNHTLPAETANRLLQQVLNQPEDIKSLLPSSCEALLDEATAQSHDKAAHMTTGLAPYSQLGMQLAALHQGNLLSAELYPQLLEAEETALKWFKQHFQLPYAQFSHGGSYNNLQALWQARDANRERKVVYASTACHYSVAKACAILGLELQTLPANKKDQLDSDALAHACSIRPPLAIILTVGTSALGAVDLLQDAVTLARHYDCWLHIDAAWGGAWLMLPENIDSLEWAQQADSLCLDPHKSLFQPRPCSVYLSRHSLATTEQTDYLAQAPTQRLMGSYGAEVFLPLWLNLTMLGEDWFVEQTRQRLTQAAKFSALLQQHTDWKVFTGGTGIVCFSTDQDLTKLVEQGVLSLARIKDIPVYRTVFADYQTEAERLFRVLHPFL
jgi:glutamate/tyrosine decarboxylase-like PLP-dependent enzyme